MKPFSPFRAARVRRVVLALTIIASAATAQAQLRLPSVNLLGAGIGPLGSDSLREPLSRLPVVRELPSVRDLRLGQVQRLLRQYGNVLEVDPQGEAIVKKELLAWSPSPAGLAAASPARVPPFKAGKILRSETCLHVGEYMGESNECMAMR